MQEHLKSAILSSLSIVGWKGAYEYQLTTYRPPTNHIPTTYRPLFYSTACSISPSDSNSENTQFFSNTSGFQPFRPKALKLGRIVNCNVLFLIIGFNRLTGCYIYSFTFLHFTPHHNSDLSTYTVPLSLGYLVVGLVLWSVDLHSGSLYTATALLWSGGSPSCRRGSVAWASSGLEVCSHAPQLNVESGGA